MGHQPWLKSKRMEPCTVYRPQKPIPDLAYCSHPMGWQGVGPRLDVAPVSDPTSPVGNFEETGFLSQMTYPSIITLKKCGYWVSYGIVGTPHLSPPQNPEVEPIETANAGRSRNKNLEIRWVSKIQVIPEVSFENQTDKGAKGYRLEWPVRVIPQ